MAKQGLGELLVQSDVISVDQLAKAKETQRKEGGQLSRALLKHGFITDDELVRSIADQYQLQTIQISDFEITKEVIGLVPKDICLKHTIIPIMKSLGTLVVACADPGNMFIKDDLTFITHFKIELVVASEKAIADAIANYYDGSNFDDVMSELEDSEHGLDISETGEALRDETNTIDEPIIKFVNYMFVEAIKLRSSDIHIETYENRFRIRFRIDGVLHEKIQPPSGAARAIINRVKILSGLDISEKRRPQDGRVKIRQRDGAEMEFRVSSVPSIFGEKIVLRLLDKSGLKKPMSELGFEEDDLKTFQENIHLPVGIVLITGPTGSGKSTTVYSALNELNTSRVNICTVEDPIEMSIDGINQVQANPQIDLGFSKVLRSFLRQDPDIVFVGEIRDYETAEISFTAALTGHMVITTLHTNDASSTIIRLTEMGVERYLVASTVSMVVAQRLVGRICVHCKVDAAIPRDVLLDLGVPEDEVNSVMAKKGEGCRECNGTGISGRVAIHEIMSITPEIREGIVQGISELELRKLAIASGMRSLRQNAILKMKKGLTSIEEVLSSTVKD